MNRIEKLIAQRDAIHLEIDKLNTILMDFAKPFNKLLGHSNKDFLSLSIADRLQVTNLLISMFEEDDA